MNGASLTHHMLATTQAAVDSAENDVVAFTSRLVRMEDAAWTEAHARYAPRLFRYLLVAARGDEDAAREALQGAFVRAVRNARVFTTEEAVWGWLTLLSRHSLADIKRTYGRWRAFLGRFTVHSEPLPEALADPDPMGDMLDRALAAISPDDRSLLEKKYFGGASVRELADASGITEKAVESRLTRARERLRVHLLNHLQA